MEVVDYDVFQVTRDADFEIESTRPTTCWRGRAGAAPPPLRRGRPLEVESGGHVRGAARAAAPALELDGRDVFEVEACSTST